MHCVSYFLLPLKGGLKCTAVYTDGSRETGSVSKDMAEKIRAFYRYANENAPYCECPSGFSIVGEIQSHRKQALPVTP